MNYSINPGEYHANASNKEWYNQRNIELYKDKQAGMSNTQLVTKYQVSPARVQYIVKHERVKHEFRNTNDVA
jgi:Mor family transcriptional regulator